jgi:hypothetical protein
MLDAQLQALQSAIAGDRSDHTTEWAVDGDSVEAIDYLIEHAGESSAAAFGLVNLAINSNLSEGQFRRIYELDLTAIGQQAGAVGDSLTFEENVLMNIASNPSAPSAILEALATHEHEEIALYARETLGQ